MPQQDTTIHFLGLETTQTYDGRPPQLTHGVFEIENPSSSAVMVRVINVTVMLGSSSRPCSSYHVYALPSYEELGPDAISVNAEQIARVEVSIPFIEVQPAFGALYAIQCKIEAKGEQFSAQSPTRFVRRIPRR